MQSAYRHFMDVWMCHRGWRTGMEEALCGVLFNMMGYLHVVLMEKREGEETAYSKARADLMRDFE